MTVHRFLVPVDGGYAPPAYRTKKKEAPTKKLHHLKVVSDPRAEPGQFVELHVGMGSGSKNRYAAPGHLDHLREVRRIAHSLLRYADDYEEAMRHDGRGIALQSVSKEESRGVR